MKRIIIVAATFALLSGCSTYKSFKTPQTVVSADLCGADVELQDTLVPVPSWKEMFVDSHLQRLIEKGLVANSDLQIAYLAIEQSEALLRSSRLAYLPAFMLSPEGTVSSYDNAKAAYSYNLPLTMQWELDIAGGLRNKKEQARAAVLQSREYARMVQTQIVTAIANTYYTLIFLDEQLLITQQFIVNQKGYLETVLALKESGLQNELAVNQASAAYYSVQTSENELKKQIRTTENSLALLINETPGTIERSPSFAGTKVPAIDLEQGISVLALSHRPDVRNAEYALRQHFYGINVARAAFYPSITLSGSAGWTNNVGTIFNPGALLLSAIGSLTQPIFNRGVNRANLAIAKSAYEQSLVSFQKAMLSAGSEVNDALLLCQSSREKSGLRLLQVAANEKAYANSTELMNNGDVTYLEVLITQSALLQSRLLQVSDWLEGVQGEINLYKALGGGV